MTVRPLRLALVAAPGILLAAKMDANRYLTVMHHKIPLPGATITSRYARPIEPRELATLDEVSALRRVQDVWETL